MLRKRVAILLLLYIGLMVAVGPRCADAQLSIANKDTSNPTLLYNGKPVLKVGPLCKRLSPRLRERACEDVRPSIGDPARLLRLTFGLRCARSGERENPGVIL